MISAFYQISLILLSTIIQGCFCQMNMTRTNQIVEESSLDANAGTVRLIASPLEGADITWTDTAIENTAKSVGGVANAGNRDIFGSAASVSDSSLDIVNTATENEAISNRDNSVSGSQLVFSTIENGSSITESSSATRNEASIVGANANFPNPTAIAGTQTLTSSISGSNFSQANSAYQNIASNDLEGKAVAGIDTAFGEITESFVVSNNTAVDNFAEAENGRSVAGIQNNIKDVTDSRLFLTSNAEDNQAESEYGNAVAGVENNFGTVSTTFPSGGVRLAIDGTAYNNTAVATNDGKAIAGVGVNGVSVEGTSFIISGDTADNKAVVKGESSRPRDAVAGVAVNINELSFSTAVINANSNGNQAFNYNTDSRGTLSNDAIAGSQVVIGNTENTVIDAQGSATDNYAYAVNGNAVAGNRFLVLGSDENTRATLDLDAYDNQAVSVNGNAVVDNEIVILGDADVTYG